MASCWLFFSTSSKLTVNVFLSGRMSSTASARYLISPFTEHLQPDSNVLTVRTSVSVRLDTGQWTLDNIPVSFWTKVIYGE